MKSEVDSKGNFLANMDPKEWERTFAMERLEKSKKAYCEYRDYLISLDATEYFLTEDEKQVAFKALKEWCGV